MNIKSKVNDVKQEFENEFQRTIKQIEQSYPRYSRGKMDTDLSNDVARYALGTILVNILRQIQTDCSQMIAVDFHYYYFPNLQILDCSDFTNKEKIEIINDTYLKDRDRSIAIKIFVENKSIDEIFNEMSEIGNKKTISNNIDKISNLLKHTAVLYNQRKHENHH